MDNIEYSVINRQRSQHMQFTKMHGCGNDYVYIDGGIFKMNPEDKPEFVRFASDRHFGIGSDGVIFINPSDKADFEMEMWNSDGTRAEMCGNGIRCVAKYVYDHALTDKTELNIISAGRLLKLQLTVEAGKVSEVRVDMGEAILFPANVPVQIPGFNKDRVVSETIHVQRQTQDMAFDITCVSMGNPHAVIFVDDEVMDIDVEDIGPLIENHGFFPNRVNVEFVKVHDRGHMDMRVWERGAGETFACGTGACASVVAAALNGLCDENVEVKLLGGTLKIDWSGEGSHVYMTGPATTVFEGEIEYLGGSGRVY